jgi:hypothetical protein
VAGRARKRCVRCNEWRIQRRQSQLRDIIERLDTTHGRKSTPQCEAAERIRMC